MKTHGFQEQFDYAEDIPKEFLDHLCALIPDAIAYRKATREEDQGGTDWWFDRRDGLKSVSVDFKWRNRPLDDPPDVCIETCSVYRGPPWFPPFADGVRNRSQVGWTLAIDKRTDLVVYAWSRHDRSGDEIGRDYFIASFPILSRAAAEHWMIWRDRFPEKSARNRGYATLSIYPTFDIVCAAMRQSKGSYGGAVLFDEPVAGYLEFSAARSASAKVEKRGLSPKSRRGSSAETRAPMSGQTSANITLAAGPEDDPATALRAHGFEVIDKRSQGGALWAVGGAELADVISRLFDSRGWRFKRKPEGGRATRYRPSWLYVP